MKKVRQVWNTQGGFSLMDIVLWAGVVLFGFFALMGLNSLAKSLLNSTNEVRDLPAVVAGVQNTYRNQPNFTGLTLDTVARGGIWPESQATIPATGTATVSNSWGGAVTLTPGTITTSNDIARMVYPNVPSRECINVANAAAGAVRRIYVDNTNANTAGGGTMVKADGGNIVPATLATACSGTSNSITFDIPKN
ncbi:type 4 pilus major pilin [Paracidovorax citrulli]